MNIQVMTCFCQYLRVHSQIHVKGHHGASIHMKYVQHVDGSTLPLYTERLWLKIAVLGILCHVIETFLPLFPVKINNSLRLIFQLAWLRNSLPAL